MSESVSVNGDVINPDEVHAEVERLRPSYMDYAQRSGVEADEGQLLLWSCENLIELALIRQSALSRIDEPSASDVEAQLEVMRAQGYELAPEETARVSDDMRIERLLQEISGDLPPPTTEELREFYTQNTDDFRGDRQIRVGQICKAVPTPQDQDIARMTILDAEKALEGGEAFEDVAKRFSDDPQRTDLGFIEQGTMAPEFEQAVSTLGMGERSEVFVTAYGYHIATVLEVRPGEPSPFQDVKERLLQHLTAVKQNQAVEQYVDGLRGTAEIFLPTAISDSAAKDTTD